MNGTQKNMKQIVAAVERTTGDGEVRTWWTRVGVAFENGDGSFNLRFDFLPDRPQDDAAAPRLQPAAGAARAPAAAQPQHPP